MELPFKLSIHLVSAGFFDVQFFLEFRDQMFFLSQCLPDKSIELLISARLINHLVHCTSGFVPVQGFQLLLVGALDGRFCDLNSAMAGLASRGAA